jgi:hypothetical protein
MTRLLPPFSLLLALLVSACASGPPPPAWRADAQGAVEAAVQAHLNGDTRIEALEFERARAQVARTGQPALMARIELMRCAARVASLDIDPCIGFERWRADAPPAERAYANYLLGRATPAEHPLLPAAQRGAAAAGVAGGAAALAAIDDPLSRLVAAGVMFTAGRASPAVLAAAVDTASAQGWRRPLLAWLKVQQGLAERAGDTAAAQALQRRITLVAEGR